MDHLLLGVIGFLFLLSFFMIISGMFMFIIQGGYIGLSLATVGIFSLISLTMICRSAVMLIINIAKYHNLH